MLEKTVEEIKAMIFSHEQRNIEIMQTCGNKSEITRFEAWIIQIGKGRFKVGFTSPIGTITMRSARRKVREFASIDSAMNAVKECGHSVATVVCGQ